MKSGNHDPTLSVLAMALKMASSKSRLAVITNKRAKGTDTGRIDFMW